MVIKRVSLNRLMITKLQYLIIVHICMYVTPIILSEILSVFQIKFKDFVKC